MRARVGFLEQEVEKNVEAIDEEREAHSSQKLALERENDLLREQLKKYVGIVQAQRRDPSDATAGKCTACPALTFVQRHQVQQGTLSPAWSNLSRSMSTRLKRNYRM